jgi:competence protein ComFA
MEFYIYQLARHDRKYWSLSYGVDHYFWSHKGFYPLLAKITLSAGVAEQLCCSSSRAASLDRPAEVDKLDEQSWSLIVKKAAIAKSILAGRALLWPEIEMVLKRYQQRWESKMIARVVQYLILQEWAQVLPGVRIKGPAIRWQCQRCFAIGKMLQITKCARCKERCAWCEHCILLGKSRTCIPFIQFQHDNLLHSHKTTSYLSLQERLTEGQQQATRQIERWLHTAEKHLLFWAVTGAGKTETVVPAVMQCIEKGKKVLWVTPRKDVVLELAPRLKKMITQDNVRALYGGSQEAWLEGNCIIATAHQALRYVDYFDLAIVDEVDAFPLYQNEWLEQGVMRALKREAKMILLTATPPREWQGLVQQRRLPAVILSQRYHGFPLPVPRLIQAPNLWKRITQQREISSISIFLSRLLETDGQAMLFVPRIQDVKRVISWIAMRCPDFYAKTSGVYGNQLQREEIVQLFRERKRQIVVTTTILERGVTVPHCHVLVLGADHLVFDRSTLIQIAGRVGRSADYQKGEVLFLANEKTDAQMQAKKELEWLNLYSARERNEGTDLPATLDR